MPKSNVCVKTKSVLFIRSQSILVIVMKTVYLSWVKNGQWRKVWVMVQYRGHICIKDLRILGNYVWTCNLKWFKPRRSRVIRLIPLGLWQSHTEVIVGLINWTIFFLSVRKLSELRRLGSNLFHWEIVDGKKEFLKKICFDLKMGRLCTFLVLYGAYLTGIKWKRYSGCSFKIFYKKDKAFCTNVEA